MKFPRASLRSPVIREDMHQNKNASSVEIGSIQGVLTLKKKISRRSRRDCYPGSFF